MGVVPALTHTRRSEVRHERAPRYRQARSAHRRSVPFRPRLRLKQSSSHCQAGSNRQIAPIVYEIGYCKPIYTPQAKAPSGDRQGWIASPAAGLPVDTPPRPVEKRLPKNARQRHGAVGRRVSPTTPHPRPAPQLCALGARRLQTLLGQWQQQQHAAVTVAVAAAKDICRSPRAWASAPAGGSATRRWCSGRAR